MGDPIIVWNPRVGDSGDDRFNVPGATKINGDMDDGEPVLRRNAQDGAPYPGFTPNLAAVQAATDISQLVALYNYKRNIILNKPGFSGSLNLELGVSSAATFNQLAGAIQRLAYYEGFEHEIEGAESDQIPRGDLFAKLRKQSGLFGTSRLWNGLPVTQNQAGMAHATWTYGGFLILAFSIPRLDPVFNIGGVTASSRKRASCGLPIYPWMVNWQSFVARVVVSGHFNCTGELWLSSTPRNMFFSSWDFLVGTWDSDGTYDFNLSAFSSVLRNTANHFNTFHLCTTEERETPDFDPVDVGVYSARLEFLQNFGS